MRWGMVSRAVCQVGVEHRRCSRTLQLVECFNVCVWLSPTRCHEYRSLFHTASLPLWSDEHGAAGADAPIDRTPLLACAATQCGRLVIWD